MRLKWIIGLLVVCLLLVSCTSGGSDEPEATVAATEAAEPTAQTPVEENDTEPAPTGGLPQVNPLDVTGDIVTAGSSTVYPLTERIAARFQDEGYTDNITIDSVGTGAGFERFCVAGETDISNASRAINDEEIAACQSIGRTPLEFRVGTDALAVVVSAENDFVENLTLEQLALAFATAETWA